MGVFSIYTTYAQGDPVLINYSLRDGLHSNETYKVFQDSKKNIWIATDAGVTVYNGNGFKTYTSGDGLTDNTVFNFFEDKKGRIWFLTYNHKICFFENGVFTEYNNNDALAPETTFAPIGFYVNDQGEVKIATHTQGILPNDGKRKLKAGEIEVYEDGIVMGVTSGDSTFITFRIRDYREMSCKVDSIGLNLQVHNRRYVTRALKIDDCIALSYNGYVLLIKDGELLEKLQINDVIALDAFEDNLWVGTRNGVYKYLLEGNSLILQRHFLKGMSISSTQKDHQGGLWYSTLEKGVYYEPYEFTANQVGEDNSNLYLLCEGVNGAYILGNDKGSLKYVDGLKSARLMLPDYFYSPGNYPGIKQVVYQSKKNIYYLLSGNSDIYKWSPSWKGNQFRMGKIRREDGEHKFYRFFIEGANLWGVNRHGNMKCVPIDDPQRSSNYDSINIQGSIYSKEKGYLYNKEGDIYVIENDKPKLILKSGKEIAHILRHKDLLYLGTENHGLYVYDLSSGKKVFKTRLLGSRITCVNSYNDRVYVASEKCITALDKKEPFDLRKSSLIITNQGFDIGPISNFFVTDSELIALTINGVKHIPIHQLHNANNRVQAIVSRLVVNDKNVEVEKQLEFSYRQNRLEIFLASDNLRKSPVYFRYRLKNTSSKWRFTRNSNIMYSALKPGAYVFEVQASTDKIHFGKTKQIKLRILPPFWQEPSFITLVILLVLGILLLGFKLRIRAVKRKSQAEQHLKDLQAQALRAQLNPHFIFNFLNSIQTLIYKEELIVASDYLSNFASLMRNYLNSFDTKEISLSKEIELIDAYLSLEKLRFKEGIDFEIVVNGEKNEWTVIPLFSQPIIENAIIHGVTNSKGTGKIKIVFDLFVDRMELCIRDNGQTPINMDAINFSKSKGIQLTRERIKNWNDRNYMEIMNCDFGHEVTFTIYKK